ncbi:MIP/aquaporin family protein [Sporanaerobacter acetigenes]|uniref:Glycerol uptake facilitator protein n=2 Tax=Sporanaerobacter acetigenes TaxID=165813 RepID=A0A1M5UNM5_9FIRM|nr:MIP/aquaporin family protein [Sporanaerobacter acetigenes]SHH64662.1 glycerol uptake facilitator protein [Sporanaerobacter acetigenes DSM 13106]
MSNMAMYLGEFFGTLILILLGSGVCCNVSLKKSKGQNSGWIVIAAGWGFAVAIAAYTTGWVSGAHLNPAVSIAMAILGNLSWKLVPGYIISQILGAIVGAMLAYAAFKDHFAETDDKDAKLGVFCTAPAIRNFGRNFITEVIGTAMLVVGILGTGNANNAIGPLGPMLAGIVVFSIGLSLGGPTGYAINPARDLGPRIAHAILPIPNKRDSDWEYAWVPIFGPVVGGIVGALIYNLIFNIWI